MGIRFAHEEEVRIEREHLLAEWLMAIQIISQYGHTPFCVVRAPLCEPASCRSEFTILLLMTVLWRDKFRGQCDHFLLPRCHDHGCHCNVAIAYAPILFLRGLCTAGAG